MTSSERKKSDRERKRQERKALKDAGAPTPGVLDRALVNALAEVVSITLGHRDLRPEDVLKAVVSIQDILKVARREFSERGLDKGGCDAAMVARLVPLYGAQGRSQPQPAQEAMDEPEDDPEAYPDPDPGPDAVQRMLDDLSWALETEDV
ncbi:hypothetical protein HPT29_018535 [Microvirga terrae]|uniref:Uncharacterized protein n=1 Tax=Microvirga terrae TaxID=2740529 RepID=A0ABY5RML3_9HYPH|nr:hypothetical protein [Microvirga terrae]UVF18470.1 hypothetical protein HPT29_018535 [Microvirga terrae]